MEKKLKTDESFDFFGMMEKQDDAFGDFLSVQAAADNPAVRCVLIYCSLKKMFVKQTFYDLHLEISYLTRRFTQQNIHAFLNLSGHSFIVVVAAIKTNILHWRVH